MHIILFTGVLIASAILYKLIEAWYIEPLEMARLKLEVDTKSFNSILKSKNDLINKLSIENAELSKQLKTSKKQSSAKKKTSKKILEKFKVKDAK